MVLLSSDSSWRVLVLQAGDYGPLGAAAACRVVAVSRRREGGAGRRGSRGVRGDPAAADSATSSRAEVHGGRGGGGGVGVWGWRGGVWGADRGGVGCGL